MRNLSTTLVEAQRSPARLPYVKVEVVERVAGVTRLSWSRLYQGSEPDFHHAATIPGDGSLLRLRVDPADNGEYRQRVENPGPNSDFSLWEKTWDWVWAVALCSKDAEVLDFHIGTDGHLYRRESSDYGVTWTISIDMGIIPGTGSKLAAAMKENHDVCLFFTEGATVKAIKRVNGVWGAAVAWTNSVAAVTGLACNHQGDWNLIVCGRDSSNNYKVWSCVYGDGYSASPGSWSSLEELALASAGSGVEFHYPSLSFPDVFRCIFIEKYTGTDPYSRPCWSHSLASADFISNLWREPVPFDLSSSYGMAMTYHVSYVWLTTPFGVWRAALSPPSVELTEDVIELTSWAEPFSGRVAVVLRNDDGRYRDVGSGDYAAIKEGSQLLIRPGYITTAGAEFSSGPYYWIEGWEYVSEGGRSYLLLRGGDGWWLLDRWRARRQFSWEKGERNIFQLLSFLFARAGLEFSAFSTSSAMVNEYPAFTVHPRESGATAVRRLLGMVADVLFFTRDCGYLKNPLADEESVYSYGTDHAILQARYASSALPINRVQVFGDGIMAERFQWQQIARVYDRLGQVHDINLETLAQAEERGDAELREAEISAKGGEILVPTNCGQDLYDVIEITDERAGLSSARRRVLGITLRYSTREPRYEQRLRLGGV